MTWQDVYSLSGIEREFLERLKGLVEVLPPGIATLQVGKPPEETRTLSPSFLISPTNPKSAKIGGYLADVGSGQGCFTIGEATWGEFTVDSKPGPRQLRQMQDFFDICNAIFTTHCEETLVYSKSGRPIFAQIELNLKGRKTHTGGHQIFWWLFPSKTRKRISYEPYY